MENSYESWKKKSMGDTAVDGLLGGIMAGVVMIAMLLLLGLLRGTPVAQTLDHFDAVGSGMPLVGLLLHLAVSGIYGILFALLARGLLLPMADSALLTIPTLDFLLAHLAYGLTLDLGPR